MGQKANPIGNRLGIIRGWESNWYGNKRDYSKKLIEDNRIRTYLNARINKGGISKIVIERTLNKLIVTIHTSKPGIIIGKGGGEVDHIKEENRINYKRAIKLSIASALRMGAEGIKIKVSGRLGGAEIARTEEIKQGRVPLHTFRMEIDYANVFALTVYGKIGIKVWICKGEVLAKRDLNPNIIDGKGEVSLGDNRRDDRRGGGDRRDDRRGDRRDDRRGGGGGDRRGGGRGDRR